MTEWRGARAQPCQRDAGRRGLRGRGLALVAACSLAVACSGGGGGGGPADPGGDTLAGRCTATLEGERDGQPYTTTAEFEIVQSGTTVTGTWTTADGRSGAFSGVIDPLTRTLTFTLEQEVPCAASFSGQAVVAADSTVAGAFSGASCLGTESVDFAIEGCVEEPVAP